MAELMECPFCKTHLVPEEGRIKHIDPAGIGCVLDGQVWPDRVVTEWNTRATDPLIKQLKDEVNRLYVKIDEDRFAALADDSVPRLVFNAAIEAIANKDQMLEEMARALEVLAKLGNGDRYGNSIGNTIALEALQKYREMEDANRMHINE